MEIQEIARIARKSMERVDTGVYPYWRMMEDAPEWLENICFVAHDSELPDNFKYECIVDALEAIAEEGDDYTDALPDPDCLYVNLFQWIERGQVSVAYVDDVLSEFGADVGGFYSLIQYAQQREREEVANLVYHELEKVLEDMLEDEEA